MNASMAINAEVPEEIVESFLGRMSAPEKDEVVALEKGRLRKWIVLGSMAGLFIGVAFYFFWNTDHSDTANNDRPGMERKKIFLPGSQISLERKVEKKHSIIIAPQKPAVGEQVRHEQRDNEPFLTVPVVANEPKVSMVAPRKKVKRSHIRTRIPKQLLRRGWRLYSQGNYQSSAVAFGRAIHSNSKHTGGYYGLALCLFEQGKEDVALKVLEKGAKKVGPKAGLWVLAGSIYQWMGKERMARIAYGRYLKNNPHGAYARDVRVILSRKHLPKLLPFEDDLPNELQQ